MAILKKIWIKRSKLGPMDFSSSAELIENKGIRNNADQNGKRQVTIVEQQSWKAMMEGLDAFVDPVVRRANLLLEGISLRNSANKILIIGDCKIKIYGETKPCERMDQAYPGLRKAMQQNWNGGVYGVILHGGKIKINDDVYFE